MTGKCRRVTLARRSNVAKHPEKMQDLTPRKFEELVAALFRAKG
jgi:hypothetical protein